MPHSLTLQINPENFKFLKQTQNKSLTSPLTPILQSLNETDKHLFGLRNSENFTFTKDHEYHISRGLYHAITKNLNNKIIEDIYRLNDLKTALKQKEIPVADLEAALRQTINLEDLPHAIEQKGICLEDLYQILEEKKLNLKDLSAAFEVKKISLEDFQTALEEHQIHDKELISFIILCLVEPIWLPGLLPMIALCLLAPLGYRCVNENLTDNENFIFENRDRLHIVKKTDNNSIEFYSNLSVKENDLTKGSAEIRFSFVNTTPPQVNLLPITINLNLDEEEEDKQIREKLANNFKDCLLYQNELDNIPIKLADWRAAQIDFCMFPVSIGLLIGLTTMCSLIALGLTPFSPLLLPPLGLALGLALAGVLNAYAQINIKKEKQKIQRPIYLYNKESLWTPSSFNLPTDNASIAPETQVTLNR